MTDDLGDIIRNLSDHTTHKDRPFTGQPHTDQGERGKTEVHGIRFRDLADCICRALVWSAAGENDNMDELRRRAEDGTLNYNDLYDIDYGDFDPIAIIQNASVEVEKMMGIYPNVSGLETSDDKTHERQ